MTFFIVIKNSQNESLHDGSNKKIKFCRLAAVRVQLLQLKITTTHNSCQSNLQFNVPTKCYFVSNRD